MPTFQTRLMARRAVSRFKSLRRVAPRAPSRTSGRRCRQMSRRPTGSSHRWRLLAVRRAAGTRGLKRCPAKLEFVGPADICDSGEIGRSRLSARAVGRPIFAPRRAISADSRTPGRHHAVTDEVPEVCGGTTSKSSCAIPTKRRTALHLHLTSLGDELAVESPLTDPWADPH